MVVINSQAQNCPFQLLDVILREETLLNVVNSVTRNGRSIILTAILALVLVYMFSIIGFLFFRDDFEMDVNPPRNCKFVVWGKWMFMRLYDSFRGGVPSNNEFSLSVHFVWFGGAQVVGSLNGTIVKI